MPYNPDTDGKITSKINQALEPRYITGNGNVISLFDVIKFMDENNGISKDLELREDIGDTDENLIIFYNSL